MMTHSAVCGIVTALMCDDIESATAIVHDMSQLELAAALAAACQWLASAWEVDAHEMGMTIEDYMRPFALAVARLTAP